MELHLEMWAGRPRRSVFFVCSDCLVGENVLHDLSIKMLLLYRKTRLSRVLLVITK